VDGADTLARSMGLIAMFGIENSGLALAVNLLLLFLVVIWLALVYWTYSDASRRIADPMLVACATAASLFPFIGTVVYLIVRPPEYLDDVRERELEIAAAQARLAQLEHQHCQYCGFETEKSFLRCPSCLRRLKEPCTVCGKPLDPRWKICPYCEAEVGQAAEGRRPRPRRAAAAAGGPPRPSAARPSGQSRQAPPADATAERPARASGDRPQSAG
ncbi:MAG TPA: zinc ribbon domain-containing protein, partial [Thermoleophilaceae bacterium]|nr:zinc ribbon domain-containing protein [Thermoleophilaceae bacterium]